MKQVKETVRCVQALHSEDLFCVSQKKHCFMYDSQGVEVHSMRNHNLVNVMDYLKYHYLLVTGNEFGDLKYQDISTGKLVSNIKTGKNPIRVMRQNKANAVMHVGGGNGVVCFDFDLIFGIGIC